MRRGALAGALTAAIAGVPLTAQNTGPEPDWDTFRRLGEAAIIGQLLDPDSARITWVSGHYRGKYKPFLSKTVYGYVACGYVNAKNRMGGFAGRQAFVVVIDLGRVQYSEIEPGPNGQLAKNCEKGVRLNFFPHAPLGGASLAGDTSKTQVAVATPPASPGPSAPSALGLSLRAMPEGAYVAAITPSSPAAGSGLMPGMVISSINGIPLAGLGDAMIKVVDAAPVGATIVLVGGKTMQLGRAK